MLNGLDLFSGIGGITFALSQWVRPVAYCENDRYAQAVLLSRMRDGKLPIAPIWDDVQTLKGGDLPEAVDIIYGGFPCQDISVAGNRVGLEGKRSGLFFEIVRLAEEIKPKFLFLENVAAIRTLGLSTVGKELARIGYDCRWDIVSAHEVGAPHLRRRWFLLAHAAGERFEGRGQECSDAQDAKRQRRNPRRLGEELSDTKSLQRQAIERDESLGVLSDVRNTDGSELRNESRRLCRSSGKSAPEPFDASWWESEPAVGRVVNEFPHRVDALRGLGNAVVPTQAREAFKRLSGLG